jgi:spermidine synthase
MSAVSTKNGAEMNVTLKDVLLLSIMTIGAGCGMIYEYIVAHYAGRITGSVDTAVYGIIGIMVCAMGVGAFYSRTIKCPYSGFAWLEAIIALIGGTAVLAMACVFSIAYVLPLQLHNSFGLDDSVRVHGGIVFVLQQISAAFPYITGFVVGLLVGMEIPFIARIREDIYSAKVDHNAGTIYGADYVGGGIGAAVFVLVCLHMPITLAAAFTALLNLTLGSIFLVMFYKRIKGAIFLIALKLATLVALTLVAINGAAWIDKLNNTLYEDKVIHSKSTPYQNLVVTERIASKASGSIINLYINGNLQFSSADEIAYHSFLVVPVMLASARHKNILVIGGGDGLAAKEIFKWNPDSITLVDLDSAMISMFRGKDKTSPDYLNKRLTDLNANALNDERLTYLQGDAFNIVEQLSNEGKTYDAIIVDLPDPNHPDLNKLYSSYFYAKLSNLLSGDGAIGIQSTSPYHSRKAFLSIGKTVESTGLSMNQYHANIPSFGEWGWTIATKRGLAPIDRLKQQFHEFPEHDYLSYDLMLSSFIFPKSLTKDLSEIKINQLSSPTLYGYHSNGWKIEKGIYLANP